MADSVTNGNDNFQQSLAQNVLQQHAMLSGLFGMRMPTANFSGFEEDNRLPAEGGALTSGPSRFEDWRRSGNIEDRRHASAADRQFAASPANNPVEFGDMLDREKWLKDANNEVSSLGHLAGADQIVESVARFERQRLDGIRAEYERRKAAGELVWDSRFEPPLSAPARGATDIGDMVNRGRLRTSPFPPPPINVGMPEK